MSLSGLRLVDDEGAQLVGQTLARRRPCARDQRNRHDQGGQERGTADVCRDGAGRLEPFQVPNRRIVVRIVLPPCETEASGAARAGASANIFRSACSDTLTNTLGWLAMTSAERGP